MALKLRIQKTEIGFLTDKEKQSLLDRYFGIEWCDDVSEICCVHCHRVAISNYVSSCQHIFCKTCSKFYNDEEQHLKCPLCQEHITQPVAKDFELEVKIHQLRIFCPNMKFGCKHADHLRKIPSHLMACINKPKEAHPVDYQVKETSLKAIISELKEKAREENNKVQEKLNLLEKNTEDNNKQSNALTEKMTSLEKKVEVELQSMKSLLESINQRLEKNESLLQQTSSNVEQMQTNMASNTLKQMEVLQNKKSEELYLLKGPPYKIGLNVLVKSFQNEQIHETKAFMMTQYLYNVRVKIANLEGKFSVHLQFKDDNITNNCFSNISRFTKVKYTVIDQSNSQNKKDFTCELDLTFDECFGNYEWIIGCVLPNAILAPPYLKDGFILIHVSFEPPSIDRSFVSNNGVLLWTVDNLTPKKEVHLCKNVFSPTFYTSPQGYRVRIRLLINHSPFISVVVNFLTGEHDASLTRNFPHMTTVTVFNQTNPSKNLVNYRQSEDVKCYMIGIDISSLDDQQGFNDSLFLKVVIEPLLASE